MRASRRRFVAATAGLAALAGCSEESGSGDGEPSDDDDTPVGGDGRTTSVAADGDDPGRSETGLLAGVPALLSGTACCGPVLFLVFGIQVSGVTLAAIQWLLPAAAIALVGSLLLVGRQVDPAGEGS